MKKGVTLIETLVAVLILAVAVTGGMHLYIENLKLTQNLDQFYYAENLLRECVESVRNDPNVLDNTTQWTHVSKSGPNNRYGKIKSSKNPFPYQSLNGSLLSYNVELDTTLIRSDSIGTPCARLKRVTATVKWGANNSKSLKMCTVVNCDYPRPAGSITP